MARSLTRESLYFLSERKTEVRTESFSRTRKGELLVQSELSAVSAGTELLVYRNQFPADIVIDETISALSGAFEYPLKYGYAVVGRVIDGARGLCNEWGGRRVFAFHPHENRFFASPGDLFALPDDIPSDDAVFLPFMETAVSFLMDGRPVIGEYVWVFGMGVIGLITVSLLAGMPVASLTAVDPSSTRRSVSISMGARAAVDPSDIPLASEAVEEGRETRSGAYGDLVYELSGNPQALDQAIAVTGFTGRIIVGSWYGTKRGIVNLGGRFHRGRISITSSQVSTLCPSLSQAWTKKRRLDVAVDMLRLVKPSRLITHRYTLKDASRAYSDLDAGVEGMLQAVIVY